ncbi:MAG: hypothetical protein CSA21_01415 [Deltaproteobacteria bacterium]|nr:MAG: hypothetical protein CSA21_01415 [Deltaproteobacteria bacterium]
MHQYTSMFFLLATSLGLTQPCWATDHFTLEDTIVTARGKASTISQTPGGVGLLAYQSLYEAQDMSITNTLRRIPGVEKSSDSAWGSAVNIRGLGRNRVVFLIDGCRVNTAAEVNAQFGFIDANDIERIEILKGPISSLYGSGSMGGVVNVITKKGEFSPSTNAHSRLGLSLGSNPGGYNGFGAAWMNSPDFWIYASGGKRDYDSYENGDGNEIPNSQFDDYNANLKFGYTWNDSNITQGNIQYHKGEDIGIPGKGLALPPPPKISYPDTYRALVSLNHQVTPAGSILTQSDLNLYFQRIDRNVSMEFPATFPLKTVYPSAEHTTWGVKWKNIIDLASQGIVTGIDIWSWEIESSRIKNLRNGQTGIDAPLADARQISAGLFLEDDISLGQNIRVNLGGRLDLIRTKSDELYNWIKPPVPVVPIVQKRPAESQHDLAWDAHAGLTWNVSPSWSTTLIAAASYRSPDLMDRYKYIALGGGIEKYGNPDLDPERSYFLEWGGHYTTKKLSLSASLYANYLDDMITDQRVTPTKFEMANIQEARIYGAELSGQWQFTPEFLLYASLAFTRGTNETNDQDLPFIPPMNGLAGISYHAGETGFYGDLNLDWACEQDKVAPQESTTDGWTTVNAKIGYKLVTGAATHDFVLGVDNLFDEQYRNHLSTSRGMDLTEPGINVYCAWKMEF